MSRSLWTVRGSALVAVGAMGLHELRYQIGYHGHATEALAAQGHAYLSLVGALVTVLLCFACVRFVTALSRARRTGETEPGTASFVRSWLGASVAVGAIYVLQELLEGWLAHGHPSGLAGVVGHGGWIAFLAALVVGAVIAVLLRGASAVIAYAAGRVRDARRPVPARPRPPALFPARPAVLARHLAARGPPLTAE